MVSLKKIIIVFLMAILFSSCISISIYADSDGIADITDFNGLSGDAQYLAEKYRDNYYLDIEKLGILDAGYSIMNSLANVLFSMIKTFAYLTVSIFYFSMSFDISKLLAPQIGSIQKALNTGIFKPLFMLALFGTFMTVAVRFWRRDLAGVGGEMLKVLFVIVISFFVVNDSATAMSYTTNITKGISVAVLNGVNEAYGVNESGSGYAAQSAGILWINLVHEPWKTLEFGKHNPSEDEVTSFLKTAPGEARQELVDDFNDKNSFDKSRSAARIGFCFAYLIPFIIKCVIYLLIALIQIVFQLLAIFFLLLAALVLVLALIPGYGMQIVSMWLKKMLETQISILIITFLLALLIRIDKLMYELSPSMGWFPVLIFQVGMELGLFVFRDKVLHAFGNIQKTIQNPGNFKNWLHNAGNPYQTTERGIAASERKKILKNIASVRHSGLVRQENGYEPEPTVRRDGRNQNWEGKKNTSEQGNKSSQTRTESTEQVKRPVTTSTSNDDEYWKYLERTRSGATKTRPVSGSQGLQRTSGPVAAALRPISSGPTPNKKQPGAAARFSTRSRSVSQAVERPRTTTRLVSGLENQSGSLYAPKAPARPLSGPELHPGPVEAPEASARPLSGPELYPGPVEAPEASTRPLSGPELYTGPVEASEASARPLSGPELHPGPVEAPEALARPLSSSELHPSSVETPEASARPLSGPELYTGPAEASEASARPLSGPELHPGPVEAPEALARPLSSSELHPSSVETPEASARPLSGPELHPGSVEAPEASARPISGPELPELQPGALRGPGTASRPISGPELPELQPGALRGPGTASRPISGPELPELQPGALRGPEAASQPLDIQKMPSKSSNKAVRRRNNQEGNNTSKREISAGIGSNSENKVTRPKT